MKIKARPWNELGDRVRAPYLQAAHQALEGLLYCKRVWEAWGVGTMGEEDFVDASAEEDIVASVGQIIYETAMRVTSRCQQEQRRLEAENADLKRRVRQMEQAIFRYKERSARRR